MNARATPEHARHASPVVCAPARVARTLERVSLATPTLPPATETNTYLLTEGSHFWVLEPATPYAPEQQALFALVRDRIARGDRLEGALLTHHHADHVGAAQSLRSTFGVPIAAHAETARRLDGRVTVDLVLDDGAFLAHADVELLHTPGHAAGHLCVLHRRDRWIVAGDMVASIGTILIDPDDGGDMASYLAQLERLAALAPARMLPAHGDPIDDAVGRLRFYVLHRLAREARVAAAVATGEGARVSLDDVVARAYDDTPRPLWPLAQRSARAHLAKLRDEGRIEGDDATGFRTA